MKVFNKVLADDLNEILNLKAEIKFQESKYVIVAKVD